MRGFRTLLCLSWLFCSSSASATSDAEILLLIDTLRPTAEAISVDGDVSDWGAIPFFSDPTGDAGANPALDIKSVAVAPLLDGLLFAVETVGAQPPLDSFAVEADFAGGPRLDFRIELDPASGIHAFTSYDGFGQPQSSTTITGLDLAAGAQAIEIKIPYSALGAALPASLATALNPAVHRTWVRVQVSSESVPGTPLDESPSIASYRLLETPYPLDTPIPTGILNANVPPIELSFPLEGRWFLGQGVNGSVTHQGSWSYDFVVLDDNFDQSSPPLSMNNADYFGFGQPFFAPASGTVTMAVGSNPDQIPFQPGFANNEVQISLSSGHSVRLLHAKQGSTLVSVGQGVDPSVQIAEVGNSGYSFQTHLHIDVLDANGTHPLAFRNMDVALNPIDDPWLRHVESWEPRVGLFTTIPEPSAALAGLAALVVIAFIRRRPLRAYRADANLRESLDGREGGLQ